MGKPDESSSSQQDERTFDAAIPAGSGAEPSSSVPRGNDEDPEKEEDDGWVYDSNEEEEDEMILIRGADVSGHGAALDLPEGTEALMRAAEEGDSDALRDAIRTSVFGRDRRALSGGGGIEGKERGKERLGEGVLVALDSPGEDGKHGASCLPHCLPTPLSPAPLCPPSPLPFLRPLPASPIRGRVSGAGLARGGWQHGAAPGVSLLLAAGAAIEARDEDGAIPLHDACAGGFLNVIGMLLAAASDAEQRRRMIAAQDCDGDTPLHNAARGEHPSVCRLLLDAGANPAAPNYAAQVPWQLVEDDSELRSFLQAAAASASAA
ncbi:unnamed protein product [Closterium sp. Naga37s-1]|nr:unnamed protein product [Closterium sp. Naga37s-1]